MFFLLPYSALQFPAHSVLSFPSFGPSSLFLSYCTATLLRCLPALLFITLRWESFCCSQPLLPAPAGATALPITSPAAENSVLPLPTATAAPSVCDSLCCDSHNNGLCSSVQTISRQLVPSHDTLIDMHTNMHRHAHVHSRVQAWLHMCTCTRGCKHTNAIHTYRGMMTLLLLLLRYKRVLALPKPFVCSYL